MKFFISTFPRIKIPRIFRDKLRLLAIADDSICWLKSVVLQWKKKITKIIKSRRKRREVLFEIGLYLLAILVGFFIIFLFVCWVESLDSTAISNY